MPTILEIEAAINHPLRGYRWRIKGLTPHPNDFIGFDGLFQTAIALEYLNQSLPLFRAAPSATSD